MRRAFPVVYVRDVGAALAFYADLLGWEEQYRFPAEGPPGYVGLKRDEADLGLAHESWPRESMGLELGDGPRFELFVYVDDVDESLARAQRAGAARPGGGAGHALGRAHGLRGRPGRQPGDARRTAGLTRRGQVRATLGSGTGQVGDRSEGSRNRDRTVTAAPGSVAVSRIARIRPTQPRRNRHHPRAARSFVGAGVRYVPGPSVFGTRTGRAPYLAPGSYRSKMPRPPSSASNSSLASSRCS